MSTTESISNETVKKYVEQQKKALEGIEGRKTGGIVVENWKIL
ncbi:MAG: hypothetical protein ACFFD4_14930 [Candidatus Odinarchaeota archaeon]